MRFIATFLALCSTIAAAAPAIRLKSGTPASSTGRRAPLGRHYLLQFRAEPGPGVRVELARRGIRVLNAVPEAGLMVSSASEPDLEDLDVTWAGPLAASQKLSRELVRSRYAFYLVVFHPDITAVEAREIARSEDFWILDHPDLLPSHLLVSGSYYRLRDLASRDEVAYILAASADLIAGRRVRGCSGALTANGPVGEYVEVSPGWAKEPDGRVDLHYFFQSLTPKIEENAERSEILRALAEWAGYTNLDLLPADNPSAIRTVAVLFAHGAHSDPYPFDGPGHVLAHTFYPAPPNSEPIAGDMHLDADEDWRIGSGVDLFSVALHEAGHALGLGHTDRPGTVMYPYYRLLTGLSDDDIAGIRDLYGTAGVPVPAPSPQAPAAPPSPFPPTHPPAGSPPPLTPPGNPQSDRIPPSLRIISPAFTIVATSAPAIAVSGTATDKLGVTAVKWTNSTGDSGIASGTSNWSARVPLLVGTNVVIVRAYDAAGNSAWRAVTVVRR